MTHKLFNLELLTLITDNNNNQVLAILLKGKWLEEAGFKCGEYVEVEVEGDKISLTKTTHQKCYQENHLKRKLKTLMISKERN